MKFKNQSFASSVVNALRGIRITIGSERNIKMQLGIMGLLIILGFLLKFSSVDWVIIILTSVIVLATEMVNTAIEITIDMICQGKYHPLAKDAKDIAAGAVLMASLGSIVIGSIVILPKIINLIK
ncbi:MAG TPA: diacylglycerol kinase family protein [Epulopiscium sp.]|nr:diacylglycerol kinase family protein [Candidatus Epulonipiscium sp.]